MPAPLPPRPSLEWLRKTARQRLAAIRRDQPRARLADAQLALAREHGFASWRALKAHVDVVVKASATAADATSDDSARFIELVAAGRVDDLKAMIARTPSLVNATAPHPYWGGRPQPLHVAIERGRRDVIDLLLDAGADVNGTNDQYDGWSPLMVAAGRPEIVEELRRRGARVGLAEALVLGDDERLDASLGDGPLPQAVPNSGSWLAFARTPHAVERLLALGARADQADRWGSTPVDALSRLGERGAGLLEVLRAHGTTATPEALARLGDLDSLEQAIEADPSILTRDSVLFAAVDSSQVPVVEWLLAQGGRPRARAGPPSRHTLLHAAAWNGHLPLVRLLVAAGADVLARDEEHHETPLGWAETSIEITRTPGCEAVVEYLREITGGLPSSA
jgi:ankyrin repeat protein